MATKVFMEALSPTMEEGRLVKWQKKEGDAVKNGDVLAEVETDKAVMELVARGDGILRKQLLSEGNTAPVGQLVGVIAAKDENIEALLGGAGGQPDQKAAAASHGSATSANAAVGKTTETERATSIPASVAQSQGEASAPPQQKLPNTGSAPGPGANAGEGGTQGTKVFMEALSPTMEEGRLVKWLKKEGDAVKNGDVLAEVETDKAVMELVARGDGVVRKELIPEGTSAPVGQLIAVIAAPDADISGLLGGAQSAQASAQPQQQAAASQPQQQHQQAQTQAASSNGGRVRSSPLARRLASERGLNLGQLQGSGPGGRIIRRDIEAAVAAGGATQVAGAAAPRPTPNAPLPAQFQDVPLTQIRKTIAKRLTESIGPIPTFYLTAEFDMERVAEARAAMAQMGDEYKASFNDIILKAVATALAQHPEVNAHWMGDKIRYFNSVNLGMAVATDDGLIVPVIFDANTKSLREISKESRELAKKARERKLTPAEYTGSTFSVSNLGMFGIDQFTAIINPPEAAILAIGSIEEKPIVTDGQLETRKRLRVTMSCDHRVIDGAVGAKFLQTLRRLIENPLMLVY